ncbi:MAG TPA: putative 2-aminoethylphosphonate ABC transporter substrate-binding protein [Caulobacteraceae bacterium]|jgi:iron(III) transport system substrate-binding protein|nr:putative 2-aminoethylphosphonate ABC transporter substrate-binding protein [Caulobacteraceae bacterium]
MRRPLFAVAMTLLAALGGCSKPAQRLVVYTAAEADQLPAYEASFKTAHPDINIVWVRDSTGVVTAKLLAEKKAEQADVVFALAATSMMQLDAEGLLAPYKPAGEERLDKRFKDGRDVPHWTGQSLWSAAVCVNTLEAKKHNLPLPTRWEDLTQPIYRGMISMPNPASSGTGLLAVGAWLQIMGEDKGWAYMDRLHQNIASYAHSGSKPCKDAARGEIPIGISIDFRAAQAKAEGLPIEIVIPKEGLGWDLEATGLVAGSHQPEAAKAFIDWAMSPAAMRIYAQNFALVGDPSVPTTASKLPADLKDRLAPIDLAWTSKNRERIIDEWSRRYSVKSEPKA